jgi:hypothetical protein
VITITAKNAGDCSPTNPAGVIYALIQNTSNCYQCPPGQIFSFKTCSCAVHIIFNFSVLLPLLAVFVQNHKYGLMLHLVDVVALKMFNVHKIFIMTIQFVHVDVFLKYVHQIIFGIKSNVNVLENVIIFLVVGIHSLFGIKIHVIANQIFLYQNVLEKILTLNQNATLIQMIA